MKAEWYPHASSQDAIVMIHGWGCQPSDFRFQVRHFKKTHSLLLPDYSAYDAHDIPESRHALEWIAEQIAETIGQTVGQTIKQDNGQHASGKVYVVSHSMGGAIAVCLAHLAPKLLHRLVFIDSSLIMSDDKRKAFIKLGQDILTDHGRQTLSDFIDDYMINPELDDPVIMKQKKQEILAVYQRTKNLLARLITDSANIHCETTLKTQCGIHYISTYREMVSKHQLKAINPNIIYRHLKSSGHFAMLNVPDEVNSIIAHVVGVA